MSMAFKMPRRYIDDVGFCFEKEAAKKKGCRQKEKKEKKMEIKMDIKIVLPSH